jgi:hypothetical protein
MGMAKIEGRGKNRVFANGSYSAHALFLKIAGTEFFLVSAFPAGYFRRSVDLSPHHEFNRSP